MDGKWSWRSFGLRKEENKMKVLMLISSLDVGGVETHVYELARGLVKLGAEVTVASNGGILAEKLYSLGITHITLPLASRAPLSLVRSYFGVRNILQRGRFDIVHAHSRIAAYIGNSVAKKYGVCFVTTVHAKFSLSPLKRRMSRWGEYTSAVSEDLAVYLKENYRVSKDRIRVIPNGIDTKRFESCDSSKKRQDNKEDIRILFVSRLDSDCSDSAYSLCRISETLTEFCKNIRITIVGGGEEYGKISMLAENINGRAGYRLIEMTGAIIDIERYISKSDIFIGVSRAALEAAASGVRVILSGNEGFMGILFEDNLDIAEASNFCCRGFSKLSDDVLLESIATLISEDGETSENTAQYLKDYIAEHHGIEKTAADTFRFYRDALEKKRSGKSICLCGYYGFGNIGDDSILTSSIERARRENFGDIVVLSKSPKETEKIVGVCCASRHRFFSVILAIGRSKILVFGGGTLFQDGTSLRSMVYYSSLVFLARLLKKDVQLWANGLGPVNTRAGKWLLSKALSYASYIGLRDKSSKKLALSLDADEKRIVLESDLAFSLTPVSDEQIREVMNNLGVNDRERFAVFSISGRADDREYSVIKRRAESFLKEGIKIIFVGMYPKEDRSLSRKLCREVGGIYIDDMDGRELVSLLRYAEMSVGMRLHLLIFSKAAGIPFEGVGKEPKIVAFCEENGGVVLF